jgi:hypothetical protein
MKNVTDGAFCLLMIVNHQAGSRRAGKIFFGSNALSK